MIFRSLRSRQRPKGGLRRWQRAIGAARSNCLTQSTPSPRACSRSSVVVTRHPTQCLGIRFRAVSGRWLVLHASRLRAEETERRIAVIFEEARPSEVVPLIVDAYGLTKREGKITKLVLRGLFTAEVSKELHITPNTVRDHFKAIFDKVGVRSRRELVGQVFLQHYRTRMATVRNRAPIGGSHEPQVAVAEHPKSHAAKAEERVRTLGAYVQLLPLSNPGYGRAAPSARPDGWPRR